MCLKFGFQIVEFKRIHAGKTPRNKKLQDRFLLNHTFDCYVRHARCFLQLLTIHLDESDVFSAWVSSIRDLGINPPSEWEDCKSKIPVISIHQ